MTAQGADEQRAGDFRVTWKAVTSFRLDSKALESRYTGRSGAVYQSHHRPPFLRGCGVRWGGMNTATADTGNIVISYGSRAGQEALDIFCKTAQRLCREATAAADAFIAATCPEAETVKAEDAGGMYHRTVRTADGERLVIVCDCQSMAVCEKDPAQPPASELRRAAHPAWGAGTDILLRPHRKIKY